MKGGKMSFQESLSSIAEIIKKSVDVNIVFGSQKEIKGKTVIPVSSVKYGFGAGSGKHTGKQEDNDSAEGTGGGGGIMNQPLGLFEITEEKICFKPVINFNHILKLILVWMILAFLKKIFLKQ
jgi:uncharacterized spore protein YtfJ